MRRILVLLLLAGVSGGVQSQQVGDPSFDTSVERPRFVRSHPRVLFDEGHHNVHRSTTTYKAFVDLLRNDGLRIETTGEPFTPERLAPFKILVIAGALGGPLADDVRAREPAFTEAEIEAVRAWVHRGGGLLLLTDHEPVASATAALVRAFGVEPSGKTVVDSEHAFGNYFPSNIAATRENGLLAKHRLTAGVQRAVVFGGQALEFPPRATVIIRVGSAAQHREGGRAQGNGQAGALQFGRGRVVITGDMGMLSAQLFTENGVTSPWGMNVPGIENRHLVRNIAHWLAGSR